MRAAIDTTHSVPGDLRLAVTPSRAYRSLLAGDQATTWGRALERPALVALLVGATATIASTGRVTPALLLSTTLSWSWVVLVQMAIAVVMTRPLPAGRVVSAARAIELWFAGHVPWTVWLLAVAPLLRLAPDLDVEQLLVSMLLPMAWTAPIAAAFSRTVLERSAVESWARAFVHHAAVVLIILSYVAWAAGGWFRLLG
jgi:hypothetical protein